MRARRLRNKSVAERRFSRKHSGVDVGVQICTCGWLDAETKLIAEVPVTFVFARNRSTAFDVNTCMG